VLSRAGGGAGIAGVVTVPAEILKRVNLDY